MRRAVIDVWIPRPDEADAFDTLIADIRAWLDPGRGVVVHCRGGMTDLGLATVQWHRTINPVLRTIGGAMHLYVEMWNAKPSWLALSLAERKAFMAKVADAAQALGPLGAEVLGAWINDADTDHRLQKTYFTAFRFPNKEAVQAFEAIVRASGWYDLFEQTNSSGEVDTFANVMEHALSL